MTKSLVVVESPAKAKTIGKYLGKNFIVKASVGHIKDLPKSKLGVDVENDFEPHYAIIPAKTKIVKELIARERRSASTFSKSWRANRKTSIGFSFMKLPKMRFRMPSKIRDASTRTRWTRN
jgi:reverse gyrase